MQSSERNEIFRRWPYTQSQNAYACETIVQTVQSRSSRENQRTRAAFEAKQKTVYVQENDPRREMFIITMLPR